jgi:hypothetical protein
MMKAARTQPAPRPWGTCVALAMKQRNMLLINIVRYKTECLTRV